MAGNTRESLPGSNFSLSHARLPFPGSPGGTAGTAAAPTGLSPHSAGPGQAGAGTPLPAQAGRARDGAIRRRPPRARTRTDLVEAALGREDGDVAVEAGAGAAGHGGRGAGRPGGAFRVQGPPQPQTPPERFRVARPPRAGARRSRTVTARRRHCACPSPAAAVSLTETSAGLGKWPQKHPDTG